MYADISIQTQTLYKVEIKNDAQMVSQYPKPSKCTLTHICVSETEVFTDSGVVLNISVNGNKDNLRG